MHQSHPPTAVCQEWALGPSQRAQQGTEPSKLAKVQRGNFLERYGDVTEQGSELLVGQVGIMTGMNRAGDQQVSQAPYQHRALCVSLSPLDSLPSHYLSCVSISVSFLFLSPHLPGAISECVYLHSSLIPLSLSWCLSSLSLLYVAP